MQAGNRIAISSVVAFGLALCLALASGGAFAEENKPAVDKLPAGLALTELESGTVLHQKDVSGQVLVLQFFASWCVGCGELMEKILPATVGGKVRFLPISVDESAADAKGYFAHQSDAVKPLKAVAALDPEAKLATALGVRAVPTLVIVGADGKVRGMFSGHPADAEMAKIKALMAP